MCYMSGPWSIPALFTGIVQGWAHGLLVNEILPWIFPRATKGEAGNVRLELLEAVGSIFRKGQTVHEETTEGNGAERWERESLGHITGVPASSHI